MGKKKEIIGNTIELDMPQAPKEPPKKKKEMTDKQRENLSKGMAILKAKRESKAKKDDEPEPQVELPPAPAPTPAPAPAPTPPPPEPVVKKERKPRVVKNYLTTEDFNSFKSELLTSLSKDRPPPQQQSHVALPPSAVTTSNLKERVISGSELLNKIFF